MAGSVVSLLPKTNQMRVGSDLFELVECLGVIRADSKVTYVLIFFLSSFLRPSGTEVVCFEKTSFDELCKKFTTVRDYRRSYISVLADKEGALALKSFSETRAAEYTASPPYVASFLHSMKPRVSKIGDTYRMYIPAATTRAPEPNASIPTPTPMVNAVTGAWKSAPAYRKCFFVAPKTASATLGGWYSYKKVRSQPVGYWYKAAHGSAQEARLDVSLSDGIETVSVYHVSNAGSAVRCALLGLQGETTAVSIACKLRPETGGWSGARSLRYTITNSAMTVSDTCSKYSFWDSAQGTQETLIQMADVWKQDSYGLFLTDSGVPHVGGPLLFAMNLVYSYDGAKLTILLTSADKASWHRYSDGVKVQLTVTPA